MTVRGTVNAHGVVEPDEVILLPHGKSARSCSLAEIRLSRLGDGWRASSSFQFMTGDMHGRASPIVVRQPTFASRDAAIEAEAARLRAVAEKRSDAEARQILSWIDGLLRPIQADLFAKGLAVA